MKKHDDIEHLFREKFRDYRVTPSGGLWGRVVKHLRRQEFLHFSPGRFNVWYLAGLLLAGAAAYLALRDQGPVKSDVTTSPAVVITQKNARVPVTLQEKPGEKGENKAYPEGKEATGRHVVSQTPVRTAVRQENTGEKASAPAGKPARPEHPEQRKSGQTASPTGSRRTGGDNPVVTESGIREEKPAPVARFDLSPRKGCVPLTVELVNLSQYATEYTWRVEPAGVTFKEISAKYTFRDPGTYVVRLTVKDGEGRISVSSDTVEVYGKPQARFDYAPKDAVVPDDEITFYNNSLDAKRYLWSFGDGHTSTACEPVHKYTTDGPFDVSLTVWSERGCADTMVLRDVFKHSGYFLRFPNAFVANPGGPTGGYYSEGSLANDVFHPVWKGVGDYHLQIFNRRGELVFESNELNRGWDGYILGQLATPGVYIWKARGTFLNGKPFVRFGNVTLIKKR